MTILDFIIYQLFDHINLFQLLFSNMLTGHIFKNMQQDTMLIVKLQVKN